MAEAFHAVISSLQHQELSFLFDLSKELLTKHCCLQSYHRY